MHAMVFAMFIKKSNQLNISLQFTEIINKKRAFG